MLCRTAVAVLLLFSIQSTVLAGPGGVNAGDSPTKAKPFVVRVSGPLPPTPTARGPRAARVTTYTFDDSTGASVEVVENRPVENPLVAERKMAKKKKEFCIVEFMQQATALRDAVVGRLEAGSK